MHSIVKIFSPGERWKIPYFTVAEMRKINVE
jgi:hypothetical protein